MQPGERIVIQTPGGGGYGKPGSVNGFSPAVKTLDPKHAWRGGSLASRLATQETSV